MGLTCYRLEQYHESIEYLNQALKIKPNYILALVRRGLAYQKIDQAQQAQADFEQAIALTPQDSEDWRGRGIALDELQRYEEAVASFDQAIEFKPDDHKAWNLRGNALSNLGRNEEAVASFDKAIEFKPDFDWAWYNRGNTLGYLGRYEEAIASFDQALKIKPDNDSAWYNRGNALSDLGRHEEAIESFDKAIKFKPNFDWAWNNRGNALSNLGRYEEAITSFDQALRIKPDSSAWNNRGISLGYLGRYEEAIASFDQALKIKPDSPAWYNRGLTLHKLERYEEAISSYDKAIEFKPDMHEALVNKGNILVKLKRDTEAIKFYESALNCIDPQWWEAWNKNQSLANIYALNKEAVVKTSVKGINTVHIVTLNEQGSSSKLPLEKLKKLQDYMRHQPSLFSDLSEAKKSYEEALEFLTFDKFPEQHLQLLQELLKVYSSDNPEEFQKNLEKGTQQLEKLLRNKSEQERIKLDSKFAAFNQMRVDILAQSEDPEKHIEALKTAEVRKNTCLAWLREGSIYQPPTEEFEFKQTQKLLNPKTAAIYWHLSPIGITTFIIKHNEPLKILSPQLPSESQQGDSRPHFYQLQRFESWMQQEWKITSYSSTSYSSKDKPLP